MLFRRKKKYIYKENNKKFQAKETKKKNSTAVREVLEGKKL